MASVPDQHRAQAPRAVRVAVLTISDTRTAATDTAGAWIVARVEAAGHAVVGRHLVADDRAAIRGWVEAQAAGNEVDACLLTGGTGLSPRDVTPEAVEPLFTRAIPGFGEVFRHLSFGAIGPATILSRACAGLVGPMLVFALPGSRAGVELALDRIILPELPHLVGQARKG